MKPAVRAMLVLAAAATTLYLFGSAVPQAVGDDGDLRPSDLPAVTLPPQTLQIRVTTYQGHGPRWWAARAAAWHARAAAERRALLGRTSTVEALRLAAVVYASVGHKAISERLLLAKARCESHLDSHAKNRTSTAKGLGQFLDSTWASTPFAGFSVFDPLANALAMGWMHYAGRGGEWAASQACWG